MSGYDPVNINRNNIIWSCGFVQTIQDRQLDTTMRNSITLVQMWECLGFNANSMDVTGGE